MLGSWWPIPYSLRMRLAFLFILEKIQLASSLHGQCTLHVASLPLLEVKVEVVEEEDGDKVVVVVEDRKEVEEEGDAIDFLESLQHDISS